MIISVDAPQKKEKKKKKGLDKIQHLSVIKSI